MFKTPFVFLFTILLLAEYSSGDDSLNNYIRKILDNLKAIMPTGDKELNIPILDPLAIKDVDKTIDEPKYKLDLNFNSLSASGLSNFNVTYLDASLETFEVKANLLFEGLKITGQYDIDGKVFKIIPIFGKGNALIGVTNFQINSSISLMVDMNEGKLSVKDMNINVDFEEAVFYLENILGGGSLSDLVNTLVNTLARPIFEKKRPEIEEAIKTIAIKELNKELKNLNMNDIAKIGVYKRLTHIIDEKIDPLYIAPFINLPNPNSVNQYVDTLLNNMKNDPNLKVDPIVVENHSSKEHHINIDIKDGRVYGLKSLHRTANMVLKCTPNTAQCSFTGELGVNDIKAHFNTKMRYHFVKIHPSIDVKVSDLRVNFGVILNLAGSAGNVAVLQSFSISHMSTPSFKIGHLGPFGKLLQYLSKLIVPMVKGKIVNAVEKPMRNALVDQLKKVKFDF